MELEAEILKFYYYYWYKQMGQIWWKSELVGSMPVPLLYGITLLLVFFLIAAFNNFLFLITTSSFLSLSHSVAATFGDVVYNNNGFQPNFPIVVPLCHCFHSRCINIYYAPTSYNLCFCNWSMVNPSLYPFWIHVLFNMSGKYLDSILM